MKNYLQLILRLLKYFFIVLAENLFFWIPEKKKRIVLYVHARKGYTCNPKYIAEYLLTHYPGQYELIWASDYPETCRYLETKGMRVIKSKTMQHFYYVMTANVNITNDFFLFNKRKQLSINTWHGGGAYKKSGMAILNNRYSLERFIHQLTYRYTNYIVSSSEMFTRIGLETFGLPEQQFLPIGMPRNDIFFLETECVMRNIRKKYNITDGKKIALYAPTYRDSDQTYAEDILKNAESITHTLQEKFSGEWILLFRRHYFADSLKCTFGNIPDVIDVSNHEDMQELLCAADVLITDYSSVIWDYGLTKRPCFLYVPDLLEYTNEERSFYLPISEWPYSFSRTITELENSITNFDVDKYKRTLEEHYNFLKCFERGYASEELAKIIENYCK